MKNVLTAGERELLDAALALPEEHDEHGCPSHRLYSLIAKLQETEPDSEVVKEMWRVSYDDGRSCPMFSIHYAAKQLLAKGANDVC